MANKGYIYRRGATPNTRTAVSQKNKIFAFSTGSALPSQIGNMSDFSLSESRAIEPVRGVGFGDQIAELVPGVTDAMEISVNRAMLYLQTFYQALGYKGGAEGLVRSLKHHRWPFDIKQELVISHLAVNMAEAEAFSGTTIKADDDSSRAIVTFFEACWINSYGVSYPADSALVNEDLSITVSDVLDNASENADKYSALAKDNVFTSIDTGTGGKRSERFKDIGDATA